MASICSHNLNHGVVVVSSCGMDRYPGRLVDDDQAIVFMNDANGLRSDWRLVSMEGMADDIAVLDGCRCRWHGFSVDVDRAAFYGIFLGVSVRRLSAMPTTDLNLHSIQPAGLETRL